MTLIGIALFGFLLVAVFGAPAIRSLLKVLGVVALAVGGIAFVLPTAEQIAAAERPGAFDLAPWISGIIVGLLCLYGVIRAVIVLRMPHPTFKDHYPEGDPRALWLPERPRLGY